MSSSLVILQIITCLTYLTDVRKTAMNEHALQDRNLTNEIDLKIAPPPTQESGPPNQNDTMAEFARQNQLRSPRYISTKLAGRKLSLIVVCNCQLASQKLMSAGFESLRL